MKTWLVPLHASVAKGREGDFRTVEIECKFKALLLL